MTAIQSTVPKFLCIEGPDGAGKTTQLQMLHQHLLDQGREVVVVREPGGTVVGESLRGVFKDHFGQTDPMTEALIMLAARQQLTVEVIQPALERGAWVLSDRHTPSLFAYQGGGHGLGFETLIDLRRGLGRCNHNADATVILTVSAEERQRRLALRGELDKIDLAGAAFTQRVAAAYEEMAHGNWSLQIGPLHVVDGDDTPNEVHLKVLKALHSHLK